MATKAARYWRLLPAPLQLLGFGLCVFALGLLSVRLFRPEGSTLAIWWPVAGLGLVGALLAEPRQRLHVGAMHLFATAAINLAGGQDVLVAATLGVLNAAQILLIVRILASGGRDPRRMREPKDLGIFVGAASVGAMFTAVAGAAVVGLAYGSPVWPTVWSLAPSHLSALVLLGMLALRGWPARSEASPAEVVAQWFGVVAVTAAVFWPGQHLSLTFVLVPVLAWGVLRSGVRALAVQVATLGTISASLTLRGGGPFAAHAAGTNFTVRESIALTQVFLVSATLMLLMVMLVVQGRREAMAQLLQWNDRERVAYERGLTGRLDLRPTDEGLRVIRLNRIAARFFEAGHAGLVGRMWCDLFSPEQREGLRQGVRAIVEGDEDAWQGELHAVINGEERYFDVALYPSVPDESGAVVSAQLLDVTDRRRREDAFRDLALRDALTGVANRLVFDDHLEQALAVASRQATRVGVIFLDLDRFKPINDVHGHQVGDQVLLAVARRLESVVRDGDTVARFGGDEFALVVTGISDVGEVDRTVDRIRGAVAVPITIGGDVGEVVVEASIGHVLSGPDDTPADLLRRADVAMYAEKLSKAGGRPVAHDFGG